MIGLPIENKTKASLVSVQEVLNNKIYNFTVFSDIIETVKFINKHNISGIKIHSTYVVKNTKLNNMYENGEYKTIDIEKTVFEADRMTKKILKQL